METKLKLPQVLPLDEAAMKAAEEHLNQLTKPLGSLGHLEEMAVQLAGITGDFRSEFHKKSVIVAAADHGIVAEGVSAYPQEVTRQMVLNFLSGGAAVNVIGRQVGAQVVCVDVGVAGDLAGLEVEGLIHKKVGMGTRNFRREAAMTEDEVVRAIQAGIEVAVQEREKGTRLIATGEMGIGNTSASSAVLAALAGCSVEEVAGRGTGITDDSLRHKIAVIREALALHQPNPEDPLDVLKKVGGFEICALAGLMIGCASLRIPVVIDGFISTVAALCAVRICPQVRSYLIASHLSEEPGHRLALRLLEKDAVLHMGMRLGEGTGAALLFPVVDTVQRIMREMATFSSAGVSEKADR